MGDDPKTTNQDPPGVPSSSSFPSSLTEPGQLPHHQDPEHPGEQERGGDGPFPPHGAASHHTTDVDNQVASQYQPSTKPLPPAPLSGSTPEAKWAPSPRNLATTVYLLRKMHSTTGALKGEARQSELATTVKATGILVM